MRRFAKVLVAGVAFLAAPATWLPGPGAASAAVVSATIFSGTAAGVSTQTVTLGSLANCPTADSSPFLLKPSGIPYQPAAGSAWSLGTIVSCGLQIPPGSLTDVAVQSAQHGFEDPLSPSDLTDPTHYQDPTAPQALPVISVDGGQNQVTYARPERSASDANGADEVVATGPVTIAVYENAPPLHVRIAARRLVASATTLREQFTATVTDTSGAAVPAATLGVSWSFEDGGSSATSKPTHAFPAGRWFVTVVVTDHATGTGGTDTTPVTVDAHALAGPTDRAGAGKNRTAPSPSGAAQPRSSKASGSGTSRSATTTSTATTTAPATTTAAPTTTATPATTRPAPSARPHRAATGHRTAPAGRRRPRRVMPPGSFTGGRVVRGLLIADVTPVTPAASGLVHAAPAAVSPAPVVRAATRATKLSAPIAVALLVALLALGAARELRGRRRWRDLRPGS